MVKKPLTSDIFVRRRTRTREEPAVLLNKRFLAEA
jgi:hypothetical protein